MIFLYYFAHPEPVISCQETGTEEVRRKYSWQVLFATYCIAGRTGKEKLAVKKQAIFESYN